MRTEAGELVALAHLDMLADAQEPLGRVLLGDAGGLQQEHERAGRAIHDRHFGCGQLDVDVVDAQAGQGRHQVLDGLHLGAVATQAGAEGGFGHQRGAGGDLDHGIQVDAAEDDAGVDRGRAQGEEDLLAAVQPHAGGADQVLEGALAKHRRRLPPRWLNRASITRACDAATTRRHAPWKLACELFARGKRAGRHDADRPGITPGGQPGVRKDITLALSSRRKPGRRFKLNPPGDAGTPGCPGNRPSAARPRPDPHRHCGAGRRRSRCLRQARTDRRPRRSSGRWCRRACPGC